MVLMATLEFEEGPILLFDGDNAFNRYTPPHIHASASGNRLLSDPLSIKPACKRTTKTHVALYMEEV